MSDYRSLDDIVFANRNKDYGAYALRNESSVFLRNAFILGILLIVSGGASSYAVSKWFGGEEPPIPVEEVPDQGRVIILSPNNEKDPPLQPQEKQGKGASEVNGIVGENTFVSVKTQQYVVPEVAANPTKETGIASKEELKDAVIGTQTQDGEDTTKSFTVNPDATSGKPISGNNVKGNDGVIDVPNNEVKPDTNIVQKHVDQNAEFPGGVSLFRGKLMDNMDVSLFEGSDELNITTVVSFVVEMDGRITSVKANGKNSAFNREAERVVRQIKDRWKPGMLKGHAVRSYFQVPITIQFQ